MLELALHILDIAENSVRAGARTVSISIEENRSKDRLAIVIGDDGMGMDETTLKRALDPFYTTKKVRRVGLGLPMLSEAAAAAGGKFEIASRVGEGTCVTAEFQLRHIDRQPLGDVSGVIVTLIAGNPCIDFVYRHQCEDRIFTMDTREIKRNIGNVPINHREVLKFIRQYIKEGLHDIQSGP